MNTIDRPPDEDFGMPFDMGDPYSEPENEDQANDPENEEELADFHRERLLACEEMCVDSCSSQAPQWEKQALMDIDQIRSETPQ